MRQPSGDDDSLIQGALRGDTACFALLMRRHRPWLCRLLRTFAADTDTAEDLAQETFARLHRHLASYRGQGQFVAYLKQIALNVGRSHLRRGAGITLVSWDELRDDTHADLLQEVLARGVRSDIRAAALALPDDQREAVLLHYFVGLTVPEIAARVQCPAGTVKSRLYHGIRKIRVALEQEKEETP